LGFGTTQTNYFLKSKIVKIYDIVEFQIVQMLYKAG